MKIEKYKDRKGETRYKFRAFVGRDENGKQVKVQKSGFLTLAQAKAEYMRVMSDNNPVQGEKEHIFQEVYEKWLKIYQLSVRESTLLTVEGFFNNHVLHKFGEQKINKISVENMQEFVLFLAENFQKYKTIFNYTKSVFDFAKKLDYITKNPCDFVIVPRRSGKDREEKSNFWTQEELLRFLSIIEKELDPKWYAFFRTLIFTGIRKGEALALEWGDIDFKKSTISVNKSITRTKANSKAVGETKTKNGNRTIDVDFETMAALKRWRTHQNRITSIVFTNTNFDYIIHSLPDKVLRRVIEKHGLTHITIHGFRHTHCTMLFESGASIKEAQDRLGHSDAQTTMNIYAHVSKERKKETVDRLVTYLAK